MTVHPRKANSTKFVLGKASTKTLHYLAKLRYQKNLEIAFVISLVAAILFFRIAADLHFEKKTVTDEEIVLKLIDIPEIPPTEPPEMKMEKVVELSKEQEERLAEEDLNEEIIEELLNEEEEISLTLNSDELAGNLISSSQLGSISGTELHFRERYSDVGDGLRFGRKSEYDLLAEDQAGLDIGGTNGGATRLGSSDNVDLEIDAEPPTNGSFEQQSPERISEDVSLGLSDQPQKILSFASSTIGTEDYKLWNRLNAELERVCKGRYGPVPKQIKKTKRGYLVAFAYSDKTIHEIHWNSSGRVWIKVIGNTEKTTIQELQRAVDGLLGLTIDN